LNNKCPYCHGRLKIVPLCQYLPQTKEEGWVFWCERCRRYFAAPTDSQLRQFFKEKHPPASTPMC